jgi:hypothetical protein
LPDGALHSVDALVTKSDGAHFLWATVHFILSVKPAHSRVGKHQLQTKPSPDRMDTPFSAREWTGIRAGTIRF